MNKTRGSRQARIDPETLDELRRIAKEEMRPVTKMITVIVREWVAAREKKERK